MPCGETNCEIRNEIVRRLPRAVGYKDAPSIAKRLFGPAGTVSSARAQVLYDGDTHAAIDSVILPIWLIFNNSPVHASLSLAMLILSIFVARRSSPTSSTGQTFLNDFHASQSSSAKGSSSKIIGYFFNSERYRFWSSCFERKFRSLVLNPRSYLSEVKNSDEAGSMANLTLPSCPAL